jgi:hypothetical protein
MATTPTIPIWLDESLEYDKKCWLRRKLRITLLRIAGSTWTVRTVPGSQNWCSVTYGNGIFVGVSGGGAAATSLQLLFSLDRYWKKGR